MAKKKKKAAQPATVICAECGKENKGGTYFCVGCGAPLVETKAPPEYDELLDSFEIPDEFALDEEDSFDDILDYESNEPAGDISTESEDDTFGFGDDFDLDDEDLFDGFDEAESTEEDSESETDEAEDLDLNEIDADLDADLLGFDSSLEEPDYSEIVAKPVNPTIENTILADESESVIFSAPLLAIPNKDILVNRADINFEGAITGEKLVICADGDGYKALVAPEKETACLVSARGIEAEVLQKDYMLRMCDPTLEEKIAVYAYLEENIETVHTIFGEKPLEDIYQDDVQKYLNLKDATPALIRTNIDNEVVAILSQLASEKQDEIAQMITDLEVKTVSKATAVMIVGSDGDIDEARKAIMQDIRITEMMTALLAEKAKPKEKRDFYRKCSIY